MLIVFAMIFTVWLCKRGANVYRAVGDVWVSGGDLQKVLAIAIVLLCLAVIGVSIAILVKNRHI